MTLTQKKKAASTHRKPVQKPARKSAATPARKTAARKAAPKKVPAKRKRKTPAPAASPATSRRPEPPPDRSAERADAYRRHVERARAWQRQARESAREIGRVPAPADPDRRAEAVASFRRYCEIYQRQAFRLEWSRDHLRTIERLEEVASVGGLYALGMPRGSGKTTLCTAAAEWAILTGRRRWTCVIGATTAAARRLLVSIKQDLQFNEMLQADFPESAGLLAALEGEPRNARGQRVCGRPTAVEWLKDKLIFPTITAEQWELGIPSPATGATITVAGLLGNIRGQFERLPDGTILRPDLAICDDPQTRRSAKSTMQNEDRWQTLNGDVLGLAGPDTKISGICPCTVILPGDMADRLLDREQSPAWRGQKCKLLYTMPERMDLWDKYAQMLRDELESGGDGSLATDFYRQHQVEMDRGAEVAWPARYKPDELSALQSAMNIRIIDEDVFQSEYQNDPNPAEMDGETEQLTADAVLAKVGGYQRLQIPAEYDTLTAFIDVQRHALYWMLCAWKPNFTGLVIDYGCYPDQKAGWFTYRKILKRLEDLRPGQPYEAQLIGALDDLVGGPDGLARDRERDDGATLGLSSLAIDAGDGAYEETIYAYCRQSSARPIPWKGMGIGPEQLPMREFKRRPGETIGDGYVYGKSKYKIRRLLVDVNQWKTFAASRLRTPIGAPGSIEIYRGKHKLLAEQLTSEYSTKTTGRGRTVWVWRHKPERFDNHWWDCLVGCCVNAARAGCKVQVSVSSSSSPAGAANQRRQESRRRVSPLKF